MPTGSAWLVLYCAIMIYCAIMKFGVRCLSQKLCVTGRCLPHPAQISRFPGPFGDLIAVKLPHAKLRWDLPIKLSFSVGTKSFGRAGLQWLPAICDLHGCRCNRRNRKQTNVDFKQPPLPLPLGTPQRRLYAQISFKLRREAATAARACNVTVGRGQTVDHPNPQSSGAKEYI